MQFTILDTTWGSFGFVSRDNRLVATYLPGPAHAIRRMIAESWPDAVEKTDALRRFQDQVMAYFTGRRTEFDVGIDLTDASTYREAVLRACRRIPYGKIASYCDLARLAGNPAAARAAGSAMAHNPIPLVIPCHRVLRADGSIGGFSSPRGVAQKKRLLELEGVALDITRRIKTPSQTRHLVRRAG